jgi:hypothetical protein
MDRMAMVGRDKGHKALCPLSAVEVPRYNYNFMMMHRLSLNQGVWLGQVQARPLQRRRRALRRPAAAAEDG